MYLNTILLLATLSLWSTPLPMHLSQDLPQELRIVLDNPEVIRLEFAPLTRLRVRDDKLEKMLGPFKPTDKIIFNLMGTNTALITLRVRRFDLYAQNKLLLLRDNQEVAYRQDVAELIKSKHTKDSDSISVRRIVLNPNEPRVVETFVLADWYEPLGPGHYVLSTQHRFIQGGKWVDSNTISFEVRE